MTMLDQSGASFCAAGYRVIAPDQRGYGLSDKPKGIKDYGMDMLVEDIVGLISALNYQMDTQRLTNRSV